MPYTIDDMISQLKAMKKKHGGDTEVQIFSYLGHGGMGIDEVKNHPIENIDDGWFFKEKGDVINIECYRDYSSPAPAPVTEN